MSHFFRFKKKPRVLGDDHYKRMPLVTVGQARKILVYNGHLREPVTLTTIIGRLAVELSLPVFTT